MRREPDHRAAELRSESEVERDREHELEHARKALLHKAEGGARAGFIRYLVRRGERW